MASKKKVGRKPAKKSPRKVAAKKKPAARKASPKRPPRKPAPMKVRDRIVTHSELVSTDPLATRAWCEKVLGWKFGEPTPTPGGPYHMWRSAIGTGGGIRNTMPSEGPGSVPYCEVKDIHATFAAAVAAGAVPAMKPEPIPGGMGWLAVVVVPGGVTFGFWGPA